jgi:hypothetical protein
VKRGRSTLVVMVMAAIVTADLYLFQGNILAFAWHARNGFHREFNGVRFRVPLFYEENAGSVMNQFSILSLPSPAHRSSSSITVEFPPWSSSNPCKNSPCIYSADVAQRLGLTRLGERTARLGNRSGNCIEYQYDALTLGPRPSNSQILWITCRLGKDLDVSFDGTRNAVPEFYAFLESASEVKQ